MELQGKRIAILAENLYEDQELWYPYLRLQEAGAEVKIVGSGTAQRYESKHGYPVQVDLNAADANPAEFDAVVIPGGYAPDLMRRHQAVLDFVRAMDEKGKVVAFICHAAWVPISAGIMKGRTATCFFSVKDDLRNAGAEYVDREVVRDRNVISSRMPKDLPAFARTIIAALREG